MIFKDRKQAGQSLSNQLMRFQKENPLILALPRGGVPVASEIAQKLKVQWNVLVVRKIGAPFHAELAVGAICEDDEPYFHSSIMQSLGLRRHNLEPIIQFERNEIQRKIFQFRAGQALDSLIGRTVIVVDDGLATGSTMKAALIYLKKKQVQKIVVAVPVAAAESAVELRQFADEVIALQEPLDLYAVGNWYEDFTQVQDEEVQALLNRSMLIRNSRTIELEIKDHSSHLHGDLIFVPNSRAMIVFAHGSGSSRHSPRNRLVAEKLNQAGFSTLMMDLLTEAEAKNRQNVFDLSLLSRRLNLAIQHLQKKTEFKNSPVGLFGASTGAGAALMAAAQMKGETQPFAIVSRGGRPDLAKDFLRHVHSPTLLIVGELDPLIRELNERARMNLTNSEMTVIPGATHLFEETGTLQLVAKEAIRWFEDHVPETRHSFPSVELKRLRKSERTGFSNR